MINFKLPACFSQKNITFMLSSEKNKKQTCKTLFQICSLKKLIFLNASLKLIFEPCAVNQLFDQLREIITQTF